MAPPTNKLTLLPALTGNALSTAQSALSLAEELASKPKCNGALAADGISSIEQLLQSIVLSGPGTNVFNGLMSSANAAPGGQQVATYLGQHSTTVGALAGLGTAASPGNIFLGNAFFNPGVAGVQNNSYYGYAQAVVLMHEAVHSIGDLMDTAFGPTQQQGSKALTQALVTNCIPVLGSQLGGLNN